MLRDARWSASALFLAIALAALLVPPAAVVGAALPQPAAHAETADLASGLAADGTFLGIPGVNGTVDASAWTLTSDLAAGEAPRFEPAGSTTQGGGTGEVDWLAVGSNGAGNGAIAGQVRALALSGENLYVGGLFTNVAGIPEADYVARWNGSSWSALGSNGVGVGALNAFVNALDVFIGEVFVGGHFTDAAGILTADYIARWNGSAWSSLGGTTNGAMNSTVNALVVVSGQVYAGGFFTDAGDVATADYIARWTGSVWTGLGSNGAGTNGALNTFVYALVVSDSDLYVGGTFTDAAGISAADRVARWSLSSSAWSALGANQAGTDGAISAAPDFVVALAASGNDVFVGGSFADAAGIANADNVARWNGTAWSALGSDVPGTNGALNDQVRALAVSGTTVYVGGFFTDAAGIATADHVARWSGSTWSALGSNGAGNGALTAAVFALEASGAAAYVGGAFANAAAVPEADFVALALVPGPWSAPFGSSGAGNGVLNGVARVLAVSGTDLYVGGLFTDAAGIPEADYVARWNGSAWSALGSNAGNGALNASVLALTVSDGHLYVGGLFTNAAGIAQADYVARWSANAWSALGANAAGTNGALSYFDPTLASVGTLAVSGTDLYVGGIFQNAAGIANADFVARWNGSAWSALGSNAANTNGAISLTVRALAVSGGNLYVGGDFMNAGGVVEADGIARWDGNAWSAVGSNGAGDGALSNPGRVGAIAVLGSILYVGGNFVDAAEIPEADYIARWNGSAWSALGSSATAAKGALNNGVAALVVSGNDLYAGGAFTNAAGSGEADYVARWNGNAWSALGSNGATSGPLEPFVWSLAVSGSHLLLGGEFRNAHGIPAADYVAAYGPIATGPIATYRPDGRIKKGSGTYVGNNVYNADGLNQTKSGAKARGSTITFGISVQNDGNSADRFKVHATGTATTKYTVRYFRGTTEITAAVVAGTYQTPSLAVGATYLISAKVKVKSTATIGSSVVRLVTIRSVANSTRLDAVKFTAKRG